MPGALAYDGRATRTAGVADLESGSPMADEKGGSGWPATPSRSPRQP
ncbi:hypothetical protein NKH18_27820 [Streptomyces sp. M10(2022)]